MKLNTMPMPTITVIIPNLNHGRYLERAICSAIDQDYAPLQLIIIDGNSTDNSRSIIKRYQEHIAFWSSTPDSGIAHALNQGLKRATGKIITCLPSNQVMLPHTLNLAAKLMSGPNPKKWIAGHQELTDATDQTIGQIASSLPENHLSYIQRDSGYLPLAGTFYHRDLLNQNTIFDTYLHFNYAFDLHARLFAAGHQPHLIKKNLTASRYQPQTQSPLQTIQKGTEQIQIAEQFANQIHGKQKQILLQNCDKRRRIYVLAQAEIYGNNAKTYLRKELFKHPQWLNDKSFRDLLAHGVKHPLTQQQLRKAA